MKIEAVIFDMDGLMFDTERIINIAYDQVGKEFGIDIFAGMPDLMGMNSQQIAEVFKQVHGSAIDYYALRAKRMEYTNAYIAQNGISVKKGLRELLEELKQRELKWSIATSSSMDEAMRNLEITGLKDDFSLVVTGDMVEKSKPNPEIFELAARMMGTAPAQTMVLEDSINGIRAAVAGGFIACMVPDLQQPDDTVLPLLTRKFESLLDAIPFLEQT